MASDNEPFPSDSTKLNKENTCLESSSGPNQVTINTHETHKNIQKPLNSTPEPSENTDSSNFNFQNTLNPHEQWQKDFNERIETLKRKEAEEIEKRIQDAAAELEEWHKNHRKEVDQKLEKLLEEEPSEATSGPSDFDWVTAANYLETSEFFLKDQSGGMNQKLIELIMKKKAVVEAAKAEAK